MKVSFGNLVHLPEQMRLAALESSSTQQQPCRKAAEVLLVLIGINASASEFGQVLSRQLANGTSLMLLNNPWLREWVRCPTCLPCL